MKTVFALYEWLTVPVMWVLYFTRRSWTHKSYLKYVDQQVARILNDVFIFYFERNEILSERIMFFNGVPLLKVTGAIRYHWWHYTGESHTNDRFPLQTCFPRSTKNFKVHVIHRIFRSRKWTQNRANATIYGGACETCHVTRIHHDARSAKSPLGFTCVERDDG